MTNRERFLRTMEYEPVDRVVNWEVGGWNQTMKRWQQEGLSESVPRTWWAGLERFQLDEREFMPINFGMIPQFKREVLEENDRMMIARNNKGIVSKAIEEGMEEGQRASMDEYLDFPVKDRNDFLEIKQRYIDNLEKRHTNLAGDPNG